MELIKTKDGSDTLVHPVFAEHYHSVHGALQESMHVFMKHGLAFFIDKSSVHVFEMGFGTGLNALLAAQFALENQLHIQYFSIEAYPISIAQAKALNYGILLQAETLFESLHTCAWNESKEINAYFELYKIEGFIEQTDLSFLPPIDLIFYDAFAPAAQEHLWEIDLLNKMNKILKDGGLLTTYCAKGQFKRNLKAAGFRVEARPGPIGKREMTLAFKN
jgi:tRNA U34 5-methylaminomethyl-2-thiouridine-forming methyltransferase MnmC